MECILECGKPCCETDSIDNITQDKWAKVKTESEKWRGLDKYGNVWETTNWEEGPERRFMHDGCYITLCSKRNLEQANKRKQKSDRENEESSNLVQDQSSSHNVCPPTPPKKRTRSSTGVLYSKDLCVWCSQPKDAKHQNRKNSRFFRIETYSRWQEFKRHVPFLDDIDMRRRITCLINATTDVCADDISYHEQCWTKYLLPTAKFGLDAHLHDINYDDGRKLFFRHVDEVIFKKKEIRALQWLLTEYKLIIGDYGISVGDMKSSYLKELLIKEYGVNVIGFQQPLQKNQSEWVYDKSESGSYVEAAMNTTGVSDEQLMRSFCKRLHAKVSKTNCVSWPPRIDQLEEEEEVCQSLIEFLSWLKHPQRKSVDFDPKTISLASFITQYVTGKRTTTSTTLGVDLHGHTRSKDLVDTFHKSGVIISYADVLYLYDVWGLADVTESLFIPREIAPYEPVFCILDNDDFRIDTLTGNSKQAHRTNVMYVQPISKEEQASDNALYSHKRKKSEISSELAEKASELTEVASYSLPKNASSEPPIRESLDPPIDGPLPQRKRSVIHALARVDMIGERPLPDQQKVPAYSGMQACLNPPGERSKAYYQTTYPEPPTKSVVHDIMLKNKEGMRIKHIPFLFLVGDLPTYVHIVELKAESPDQFEDIIPILGPFHQQMSFIHCIYKRFRGSGIADVLVSAGVIVEGSVDHALRGKHYRRGVRCIMLLREALIHSRIKELMSKYEISDQTESFLRILRKASEESQDILQSAQENLEEDDGLQDIVSKVYRSNGTDMEDFWISFLEMTDVLIQNIHACHVRDVDEYLSSTYDMFEYLMAYNNHGYGRWLPDYWASISSLTCERYRFFRDNFTQSITGLPYSFQGMDLWIECTMNLGSKLKQGWLNLLDNEKQLFSTTRNVNNISRVRSTVKRNLKKKDRRRKHIECQMSRMKKDERAVQDIEACLEEFDTQPFDESNPVLRTLQSGVVASAELISDSKKALEEGKEQVQSFLRERVFSKELSIRATIHRNKRIDFENDYVPTAKGGVKEKAIQMEKDGLLSIFTLAEKSNLIDLAEVFSHRVTTECLGAFNFDGSMRKTQKSKALEKFDLSPVDSPRDYVCLLDMGFIWRQATPTSDDREILRRSGSEYTWGDYAKKVVSIIASRHAFAKQIVCVNDVYDLTFSIKDDERDRRSLNVKTVPNIPIKSEDKFPSSGQLKNILANSSNKIRIQNLIEKHMREFSCSSTKEIVYCTGSLSRNLLSGATVDEFSVNQAEADTALFTIYYQIRENGWTGTIVIDAEDTDIYVQASYVAHKVSGKLLIKKKHSYIDCRSLLSSEMAEVMIQLHVMTGSDHNCGFYGRGKKAIIEKVTKVPEARALLHGCGDMLPIPNSVLDNLKKFVINYVYGSNEINCAETRAKQWKKMKKKNTQRLMPDDDTLNHICIRANYLSYCQRNYQLKCHPTPIGNGWNIVEGRCRPVRNLLPALPVDLVCERIVSSNDNDNDSDSSSDCSEPESDDSTDNESEY